MTKWEGHDLMSKLRNYIDLLTDSRSARRAAMARQFVERLRREQGSSLVEMALSVSILIVLLLGFVQFSLAVYAYNMVSEAAREATRYAAIRGTKSCDYATSTFPDCNLGPDSSGTANATTALQNYIKNRNFPLSGNVQVVANWLSPTGGNPNQWTATCSTAIDNNTGPLIGDACNFPGHAVQVQVTVAYPLTIPFWGSRSLNLTSTSQMVISE